jgi:hypothetical protein
MLESRRWILSLLFSVFVVALVSCSGDEEGKASVQETYSVSGTVTRSVDLDPRIWMCRIARWISGNPPQVCDAKGDVYLHVMDECPSLSGCLVDIISEVIIPDADLSEDGASIPFEATGIPDGTYYLSGLLDDAPNIFNPVDISETGDLVMFGLAAPRCVEVTVSGGNVTGVNADFDSVMPFALPMDDVTCNEPDDDDPDIVDDGNTYTVFVTVTRGVINLWHKLLYGTDGIGVLRVGLLAGACFKADGSQGEVVAERIFEDPPVDLSANGSEFQFEFDDIPNGIYYINGFIDDVTNATEERPLPAHGDLVSFRDLGPGCVKVIVNGADVIADPYELNMVMPFDLNDM